MESPYVNILAQRTRHEVWISKQELDGMKSSMESSMELLANWEGQDFQGMPRAQASDVRRKWSTHGGDNCYSSMETVQANVVPMKPGWYK